MAEVLEARREGAEQTVVLKVLLPQHAADPEFAAMLADEARLALDLVHPNLVRVLEVGEGFLAMERIDGPPLSAILRHVRRCGQGLPAGLALLVGEQLLEALSYIHGRQDQHGRPLEIVHRDISPGNVLISRRGEVKLGDFGIARHRLRSARTRTGVIKGTVQYMAPEQVLGGDEVDRRTDLYGVGLLLFEMLTGRPFLDAEREVDLLRRAENPPWVAPSSVRPGLDPRLDRLLRPALARYPEERYPSAESFAAALRSLRAALASSPSEEALQAELGALACAAMEASAGEPAGPLG
jgi:serine/threonine-protein kinase